MSRLTEQDAKGAVARMRSQTGEAPPMDTRSLGEGRVRAALAAKANQATREIEPSGSIAEDVAVDVVNALRAAAGARPLAADELPTNLGEATIRGAMTETPDRTADPELGSYLHGRIEADREGWQSYAVRKDADATEAPRQKEAKDAMLHASLDRQKGSKR